MIKYLHFSDVFLTSNSIYGYTIMGRKTKYFTDDEKQNANRKKSMRYYWKNSEKIKKKNLERYHGKINNN